MAVTSNKWIEMELTIRQLIEELQKADNLDSKVIIYDEEHEAQMPILCVEWTVSAKSQKQVAVIRI